MLNLLPTEVWQYSIPDSVRGCSSALNARRSKKMLVISGLGNAVPVRSARVATVVAIKALDLKPGSRIGIPLHCCPVVFKAIKAAGCKPRFIDIDPETFCLSIKDLISKSSDIDALIAVHMFGNICDMLQVMKVMNGKSVVEDCAQSLGSKIEGRPSGSFGHISFFSFRSGKYISAGEGGALFSSDPELVTRFSDLVDELPSPGTADEIKHVAVTYIRSKLRSQPLWGLLGQWIWRLYNKKVEFTEKSPIIMGRIFASDLAIINHRFIFLDYMIARQRENADYFLRHLEVDPSMLCYEKPGTFYNRFMFPVIFPSTWHRNWMAGYLKSQMISTAAPYEDAPEGAARHYGYEHDCPQAEQLLKRTLVIPSHFKLKPRDVIHITSCFNAGWKKIKPAAD